MRQLNPTLWRTCRVLSGGTRLKLLRQIHDAPGQSVSDLAKAIGIGVSDASQELRRLQSRGLLQAERKGAFLIYRLGADPQVPSAAPLLKALKTALETRPADQDAAMLPIAAGLAHARRIAIVKALAKSDLPPLALRTTLHIPQCPMSHHLKTLKAGGWVQGNKNMLALCPPAHPLARALALLAQAD